MSATVLSSLNALSETAVSDEYLPSDALAVTSVASAAPLSLSVVAVKRRYEEEDDLESDDEDFGDFDDEDDFEDDDEDFDDFDDEDDFDDFEDDDEDFDDFDDEDDFEDDEEFEDRRAFLLRQIV